MIFIKHTISIFLIQIIFTGILYSGEIDNKGLICSIYGDKVGFLFQSGRVIEYKFKGGETKLEINKQDIGKYETNENSIFFGETRISRRTLKYRKYSSFRGICRAYDSEKLFLKEMNIKKHTSENKI